MYVYTTVTLCTCEEDAVLSLYALRAKGYKNHAVYLSNCIQSSRRKIYLLETLLSRLFLIEMKLAVLTVALLLCAVLATTVTAAPSGEKGKNFS